MIAVLKDRVTLVAVHPNTEADAIRLLFIARGVTPTDAAVLSMVREVEMTIGAKPGLKTAMMDVGRPAANAVRTGMKGSWFDRRETETSDTER